MDKVGSPVEREDSEAMWWGRAEEPLVARRYKLEMRRRGVRVRLTNPGTTLANPQHTWMLATPDRFVEADGSQDRWGLECKIAGSRAQTGRWGSGGDEVPEEYLVQCQWCMAVCELDRWDVAVRLSTFHGVEFRVYELHRDAALVERLREIAQAFLRDYVAAHEPPPPDGSQSARRALVSLWPADAGEEVAADQEFDELAMELSALDAEVQEWTQKREEVKQRFMRKMGHIAAVRGEWGTVTWRTDKRGRRVFRPFWRD